MEEDGEDTDETEEEVRRGNRGLTTLEMMQTWRP